MSDYSPRLTQIPALLCLGGAVLMSLRLSPAAAAEAPQTKHVSFPPSAQALRLHPDNPHYFLFRGQPTLLITSGEHYGAVLNRDFDYTRYLDTLQQDGMNGTRLWVGAYCEPSDAFQIARNTLAPGPGRFLSPWARSDSAGYENGGGKFDLSRWDKAYFKRLRDFVAQAGQRGIIVEVNLFCPFYEESMWRLSPMNSRNNINGLGSVASTNVYTLDLNDGLLAVQDALARKVAAELNRFDNFYFEICNEPYFGGVTLEWQQHIAAVLGETEARLRNQHLISQNIANLKAKVERPDPAVSIFNFHYASPPDAVAMNYQLNKVIGDNETGFRGTNDAPYRMEAWDFMIAGGGLFNHLDYSFTVGHEDGSFVFPASQPGGGTPTLRRQLRFLGDVLRRFDFVRMKPATDVITEGVPPGMTARALARLGSDYLIYLRPAPQSHGEPAPLVFAKGQVALGVALPAGQFIEEWYDPRQCVSIGSESVARTNGVCTLAAPAFQDDLLLVLRRTDGSSPRGSSRPGRFTAIPRPGEAPQEEPVSSLPDLPTVLVVTNVLRHAPDSKPISPQPEQPRSSRMPTEPLASGRDKAPAAEAPQAAVFPPNIVVVTNTLRWTSEPRSGPQTNFEPTRHAMPADKPTPTRATLDFPPSIPDVIVETNLLWRSPSPVASSR